MLPLYSILTSYLESIINITNLNVTKHIYYTSNFVEILQVCFQIVKLVEIHFSTQKFSTIWNNFHKPGLQLFSCLGVIDVGLNSFIVKHDINICYFWRWSGFFQDLQSADWSIIRGGVKLKKSCFSLCGCFKWCSYMYWKQNYLYFWK